jgi:hypothetical protein
MCMWSVHARMMMFGAGIRLRMGWVASDCTSQDELQHALLVWVTPRNSGVHHRLTCCEADGVRRTTACPLQLLLAIRRPRPTHDASHGGHTHRGQPWRHTTASCCCCCCCWGGRHLQRQQHQVQAGYRTPSCHHTGSQAWQRSDQQQACTPGQAGTGLHSVQAASEPPHSNNSYSKASY